jgi:hemolysin activation/secretion protein
MRFGNVVLVNFLCAGLVVGVQGAEPLNSQEEMSPYMTSLLEKGVIQDDGLSIIDEHELLKKAGLKKTFIKEITSAVVTEEDAVEILNEYTVKLRDKGYYLAEAYCDEIDLNAGKIKVRINSGTIKTVTLKNPEGDAYSGRHFKERQIRKMLAGSGVSSNEVFNYANLYNGMFKINSRPDLTLSADLAASPPGAEGERKVDLDFSVEEKLPIHAIVSVNNNGSDETDRWGLGLTLQHLNLTKHDDVLTFSFPWTFNLESIRSFVGTYYLPHDIGSGGGVSLWGGYSDLKSQKFEQYFEQTGKGWFVGTQFSLKLLDSENHDVLAAIGMSRRYMESTTYYNGQVVIDNPLTLNPLSASLSYSTKKPDALGGRTFLLGEYYYHPEAFLGASDDAEFSLQRRDAKSEYSFYRWQVARIQLMSLSQKKESQWQLFMRAGGQYTDQILVPAEQFAAGGSSSVRGYKEMELLGDIGYTATAELRTPLLLGFFSAPFMNSQRRAERIDQPEDYLQLLLFADYGYLKNESPLAGETPNFEVASVGAGFRVALSEQLQVQLDWGYPLKETEQTDIGEGRLHFNLQWQF